MVEKKSLVLAMEVAQQLSIKHPGVLYYVMDKPRKRAVVSGSKLIYRERVLEGWHCYCKFRDGRMV